MADVRRLLIEISNLPEEAKPELGRVLWMWLVERGGGHRIDQGRQDPGVVSLDVTFPTGSDFMGLVSTLVQWGVSQHLGRSITFKVTVDGQSVMAELRSGASDAEIAVIEYDIEADVLAAVGASTDAEGSRTARFRVRRSDPGKNLSEEDTATTEPAEFRNGLLNEFVSRRRELSTPVGADDASTMPVTIYLSDEGIHEQVETAVEALLGAAGLQIESRNDPIAGSWFRRMRATVKEAARSPAGREATLVAAHIADTRLVLAQDAAVTATLLQNLGPVLGALQPTKDAIIRAGALLIVKADWTVHVFQLTAAQQAVLDHPAFQLDRSPREIITALNLTPEDRQNDGHPELT